MLATAVSGLVAAGVFASLDGVAGLAGWQWLFTIVSATSSVAAIAAVYVLPDYPESKTGNGRRLFTEDERQVAVERIARDRVSTPETNGSVFYGLKLATSDYRTWIFALLLCSNHSASGFNNCGPCPFIPTILLLILRSSLPNHPEGLQLRQYHSDTYPHLPTLSHRSDNLFRCRLLQRPQE